MIDIASFIPKELYEMAKLFPQQAPLYVVGGFVRDVILYGKASDDIDITSALTPPELAFVLKNSEFKVKPASLRLGTMIIKGERAYEYTSFRVDSYPAGAGTHAPQDVTFTRNIEKDSKRRDFKCNAVYYDILNDRIVDPLGGLKDIENKILSTTVDPNVVLSQDGLRIMRLARLASTHNFKVEENTYEAMIKLANRLRDISVERITSELLKILLSDNPYIGLDLLRNTDALKYIIPELAACDKYPQNPKFHKYDVLEHTFKAVMYAPKKVRLAALFHDIAKPPCQEKDGNTYKHDIIGAGMTKKILTRMKFPKQIIDYTVELVAAHMFDVASTGRPATIRRFIATHSDNILDIVALKKADAKATGMVDEPAESSIMREYKILKERNIPLKISEMSINGKDLAAIGFKGREIGEILDEMFDACLIEGIKPDRESLLAYATRKKERRDGNRKSSN